MLSYVLPRCYVRRVSFKWLLLFVGTFRELICMNLSLVGFES